MANVPTIVVGTGNQQKVVTPALLTGLDSTGAIVALRVDASGNLLTSGSAGGGSTAPVALGNITGTVAISRTTGEKFNAAATGSITLNITDGSDFDNVELWVTASGADRTLNLNAAVKVPSDSAIAFPVTITSGKGCRVKFEKHGATWMLVSLFKSYIL